MPKNKGKGGKNRRRGKNENENQKRELVFKEPGQEYAKVDKMLGNGRLHALCFDGRKRLCHIRGKLRKKIWINAGDIILVGLRQFQDDKADVILKYSPDEARMLKDQKQIPESVTIEENDQVDFTADADVRFDGGATDSDDDDEESEEESSEEEESEDERDDKGVKLDASGRAKTTDGSGKPDGEGGSGEEGEEEEEESDNDTELVENPNRPSGNRSKASKSQGKWGKGGKNVTKTRAERAQEEMIDAI